MRVLRSIDAPGQHTDYTCMSDKTMVLEAIQKLPEEATLRQIRERIEFLAAVQEGLAEIKAGNTVSLDEVERKIERWATR